MQTWFTADTHFNHTNIIKYCNRPFSDTKEMNETIISNWNKVIQSNDLVYHLGDFMFGVKGRQNQQTNAMIFDDLLKRLNGSIVFIKGNHDSVAWTNREKFYANYDTHHEIEVGEQYIVLNHYAMRVWNKSHYGAWNLYGHSHGTLPDDPNSLSIDVGVDCHNFTPISFDQVKEIMSKKFFIPIDHHQRKEEGGIGLNKEDYAREERKRLYIQLHKEFGR